MITRLAIFASFAIFLLIAITPSSFAAEVPDWIKNNAGWWADGTIDDISFVSGIEWLISNGIIEVPSTAVSGTAELIIPSWVKNTAGWWADEQISDDDFVNSLQYLIKVGIMTVPQAEQAAPAEQATSVTSPEAKKLLQKREAIIDAIWKDGDGFPTRLPDSASSMKITVEMKHGINSIMYLKQPSGKSNNELVIYHCGHDSKHLCDGSQVNSILKEGYSVLRVAMPLKGQNSTPSVDPSPHCPDGCEFWPGPVTMQDGEKTPLIEHNQLEVLESDDFSPMSYFVEPIAVALNHIDENFDYSKYHMIGISGGGWTTVFYTAIDPRISHSFSVAGSHPVYSMTQDYEQRLQKAEEEIWGYDSCISPLLTPELCNGISGSSSGSGKMVYQVTDWKDLYVLASFGEDRKLTQWFHTRDSCCFAADELNFDYEEDIKKRLTNLGSGEFEIFIESTSNHAVSTKALAEFLSNIE